MILTVSAIMRAGSGAAAQYWRNTHELDMGALTVFNPVTATDIAHVFSTFHQSMLNPNYAVDRVIVSTYSRDSQLFPDNFVSVPFGIPGARISSGELTGLETCLVVRRTAAQGRSGRMWLRGMLTEGDIVGTSGGSVVLNNASAMSMQLNARWQELNEDLEPLGANLVLVRGEEPLPNVRSITGFVVAGVGFHRLNRRVTRLVSANSPLGQIAKFVKASGDAVDIVNTIATAYNALPYPDVPLLPSP